MNLKLNQINYKLIKRKEFYKSLMQKWLNDNDFLMHSTNNEGKSVVARRFIKTLKTKICKKKRQLIVKILVSVI